jgi:hypothetical protein
MAVAHCFCRLSERASFTPINAIDLVQHVFFQAGAAPMPLFMKNLFEGDAD